MRSTGGGERGVGARASPVGGHQSTAVGRSTVWIRGRVPRRGPLLPRRMLHALQMICTLLMWSAPPRLWGMMWSASGEAGVSELSQSRRTLQMGQCVRPCACAVALALRTMLFHSVVPVREVAMVLPLSVCVVWWPRAG